MTADLIRDPSLREAFDRDGFVYVRLLSDDDVSELTGIYERTSPPMPTGFYTTLWSADLEYRQQVHEGICRVLERRLADVLAPAKFVLTQFAVKQGGRTGTECPLHQDWSLTDEARYPCVSIWCPLVDVDAVNGSLAVVPGSHRVASRVRPNMPFEFYSSPVAPLYPLFADRYLHDLPMRRGGALLYNGALTHGSRPNRSATDRAAVVAALVPVDAPVLHYWMPCRTEVEVFEVPADFYRRGVVLGSRPSGVERREVLPADLDAPPLTEEQFLAQTADVVRNPVMPVA